MLVLGLGFLILTQAASERPLLGVIDLVADSDLPQPKAEILAELRSGLKWQSAFEILREEETNRLQRKIDPRKQKLELLRFEHQRNAANFQAQLRQAIQLYAESRFEDSLSILKSSLSTAEQAYFEIPMESVDSFLSYKAANEYFLGQNEAALESLRLRNFFFDSQPLDAQRFPPDLLSLEAAARRDPLPTEGKNIFVNHENVELKFFGKILATSGPQKSLRFDWPKNISFLSAQPLVVIKDDFQPELISASSIPPRLSLSSFEKEQADTSGLFGVLGSLSPSTELIQFLQDRKIDIVLLANASVNFNNQWVIKGQLFRARDRTRTPVVEAFGKDIPQVTELLVRRLLVYVDAEGDFVESRSLSFVDRTEAPKPIYKKWWFWTAVGVGAAGLGAGSYYLLKPDTEVRFSVRERGE